MHEEKWNDKSSIDTVHATLAGGNDTVVLRKNLLKKQQHELTAKLFFTEKLEDTL